MHVRLVASAWTSAGDTSPMRSPATSPVPIAERIAAVADAGYVGMGLIADDLRAIRDSLGFPGLRDMIADAGLEPRRDRTHRALVDPARRARQLLRRSRAPVRGGRRARAGVHQDRIGARPRDRRSAGARRSTPAAGRRSARARHPDRDRDHALLDHRDGPDGCRTHRGGRSSRRSACSSTHGTSSGRGRHWTSCATRSRRSTSSGSNSTMPPPSVVGTLFEDTVDRRLLCGDGAFDLPGLVTCCVSWASTDRGAWRSCPSPSARCRSARRSSLRRSRTLVVLVAAENCRSPLRWMGGE